MKQEIESGTISKEEANEIYAETTKEPYTKYPNKYIDKIEPKLSKLGSLICRLILRLTYGYHVTTAEISMEKFVKHCTKPGENKAYSRRQIINEKNKLIEMGLLKKLKKGVYCLDIFYDIIRKPLENTEQPSIIQFNPLPHQSTDIPLAPSAEAISAVQNLVMELSSVENPYDFSDDDVNNYLNNYVDNSVDNYVDNSVDNSQNMPSDNAKEEISENPVESSVCDEKKVNQIAPSARAYNTDGLSITFSDLKTNKENWKSVCFAFAQRFGIAIEKIFGIFAGLDKKYGLEYINQKIQLIYDFAKKRKIENPIGFLVCACNANYLPPRPLRQQIEIKAKAKRVIAADSAELKEREEIYSAGVERTEKAENIRKGLSAEKIKEYVERATKILIDKGARAFLIPDIAIQSEANQLILAECS